MTLIKDSLIELNMELKGEFSPEGDPTKLIKELQERAQYYCKGFGGWLSAISGDIGNYLEGVKPENTKKRIETTLSEILEVYKAIPFEKLHNHPDYDLLIDINSSLPSLENEVHALLNGKTDKNELNEIIDLIMEKGREFRERLVVLQNKIRQYPGLENFSFKTTDMKGKLWNGVF